MFCSNCGRRIPDGSKYCSGCGAKQEVILEENSAVPASSSAQPVSAPSTPVEPAPNQPAQGQSAPAQSVLDEPTPSQPVPGQTTSDQPLYGQMPPVSAPYVQPSPPVRPVSRKKKIGYMIFSVAVFFVMVLLVSLVIRPALFPDDSAGLFADTPSSSATPAPSTEESLPGTLSAYDEIFSEYNIAYTPTVFPGMDSACYAVVDEENGLIDCMDFGYQSDMILEMTETIYFFIDGYTDSEREILDSEMRNAYADFESLSFCSAEYDMDDQYYIVRLEFTDLDQPENCQKLVEFDMVEEGSISLSMKNTDTSLSSQGYEKK